MPFAQKGIYQARSEPIRDLHLLGMPATGLPMGGGSAGGECRRRFGDGGLRPPQMPAGLSNPLGSGGKSLSDAFTSPAAAAIHWVVVGR